MNNSASILIVDDDPLLLQMLHRLLAPQGYILFEASNAAEALSLAREQRPDLVLLDVALSEMDGIQVCQRIKEELAGVHIILLSTAKTASKTQAADLAAGADDYVVWPVSDRELLVRVEALLRIKRAERALQEGREFAESVVATVREPLLVLDADLRVVSASRSFYTVFQTVPEETIGRFVYDLGNRQWDIPALRTLLERILPENTSFDDFEVTHEFEHLGHCTMLLNARRIYREANGTQLILLAIEDITERKRAEGALQASRVYLQAVLDSVNDAIFVHDDDTGQIIDVNQRMCEMYGYAREEALRVSIGDLSQGEPPYSQADALEWLRKAREIGPQTFDWLAKHKDGHLFWVEVSIRFAIIGGENRFVLVMRDTTERKRRELVLEAEAMLAQALGESLELRPLLERLLAAARHAVPAAEKGSIMLAEPDGRLRIRALNGYHDPRLADFVFDGEAGYSVRAARERRSLLITDVHAEPEIHYSGEIEEAREIRSAIVAPLLIQERLIGVIALDSTREAAFTEQDLRTLTAFAAPAALILENARLFEETQQRLAELSVLRQASQQLLAARLDAEATYAAIHRAVAQVMPCEAFVIVLEDPAQGDYHAVYLYDKGGRYPAARIPRGQGLSGHVISHGQTTLVDDLLSESDLPIIHFGDEESVRSVLAVPLREEGKTIGMVSAQSYRPHTYGERHRVLLETLAAQFGAIIESAHLYQQTQRRLREMELIANLSAALRAADSRAEVLSATLDQLSAMRKVDGAAVGLLDSFSGELRIELAQGEWTALTGVVIPPGEGLSAHVLATGQPYLDNDVRSDSRLFRPDAIGECRAVAGAPLIAQGRIIGLLWVGDRQPLTEDDLRLLTAVADIVANSIQRITFQEALKVQARRMAQVLDTVPQGVLLLDAEGRIVQANPLAEENLTILAPGARMGDTLTCLGDRMLADLLTSPPRGLWHEVKANRHIFEIIARPMENGPEPEYWVLVINDATREREVQAQLEQQERLAAVGQLAAGIAHDFNNIMATIILYARMLEGAENLSERDRDRLAVIGQQGWHATRLIQQILDFSRRAVLERQPLDLLPLLKEQVRLLGRTLPEDIEIALSAGQDEYTVHADPTRMQQMLTNLAVNARDAMPNGGILRFGLERVTIRPDRPLPLPDMEPGEWIRLTVSDTGMGIAPDVLPHIFEPFFTTKEPGTGSGLGLAQVHGIVGQHGGHIGVETRVGKGTTFTIYLPALAAHPSEMPALDLSAMPQGQGELVLVVEDDIGLRGAIKEVLESLNYQALEAMNGQEALALMASRGEQVALVLSDMVMPGMGGMALLGALRQEGWQTPVILLTGHAMEVDLHALRAQGLTAWLTKPISPDQLAQVVAEALHRQQSNNN